MGALSRAGLVLVLILAGCSAAPAAVSPTPFATESVETEPIETEPIDTEAPPTDTSEPTPAADHSADSGLPLSDGNGWPMTVSATLSGTFYDSDGSYSGSGAARWCGNALGNISLNLRAF